MSLKKIPWTVRFRLWVIKKCTRANHRAFMNIYKFDIRCSQCKTWQGNEFKETHLFNADEVCSHHDVLICNHCGTATVMFDFGMGRTEPQVDKELQDRCIEYAMKKFSGIKSRSVTQ